MIDLLQPDDIELMIPAVAQEITNNLSHTQDIKVFVQLIQDFNIDYEYFKQLILISYRQNLDEHLNSIKNMLNFWIEQKQFDVIGDFNIANKLTDWLQRIDGERTND